ncbi:hypothetical protein SLEP1_g34792 [Rubroshorea leprosula]|uniref:Uncharacterized protein n=1 Tax=Rubroshorea leprosula TaxID=152421 RepID=A0AAV5KL56_9ROSI|nr:hypothetical protein SLEP1_g34792 [Rubroshorea leprosula]
MEPDAGFSSCSSWFFAEPKSSSLRNPDLGFVRNLDLGFVKEPRSGFCEEPSSGFLKEPSSRFREEPSSGFLVSSKNLGYGFREEPLTNPEPSISSSNFTISLHFHSSEHKIHILGDWSARSTRSNTLPLAIALPFSHVSDGFEALAGNRQLFELIFSSPFRKLELPLSSSSLLRLEPEPGFLSPLFVPNFLSSSSCARSGCKITLGSARNPDLQVFSLILWVFLREPI